jgi:Sulfatase-modifying factor enzyme 1
MSRSIVAGSAVACTGATDSGAAQQQTTKQVVGEIPGKQPRGEGNDFPVVEVNYTEAEGFCRTLTEQARKAGDLPNDWEFRLPTEAQWEAPNPIRSIRPIANWTPISLISTDGAAGSNEWRDEG